MVDIMPLVEAIGLRLQRSEAEIEVVRAKLREHWVATTEDWQRLTPPAKKLIRLPLLLELKLDTVLCDAAQNAASLTSGPKSMNYASGAGQANSSALLRLEWDALLDEPSMPQPFVFSQFLHSQMLYGHDSPAISGLPATTVSSPSTMPSGSSLPTPTMPSVQPTITSQESTKHPATTGRMNPCADPSSPCIEPMSTLCPTECIGFAHAHTEKNFGPEKRTVVHLFLMGIRITLDGEEPMGRLYTLGDNLLLKKRLAEYHKRPVIVDSTVTLFGLLDSSFQQKFVDSPYEMNPVHPEWKVFLPEEIKKAEQNQATNHPSPKVTDQKTNSLAAQTHSTDSTRMERESLSGEMLKKHSIRPDLRSDSSMSRETATSAPALTKNQKKKEKLRRQSMQSSMTIKPLAFEHFDEADSTHDLAACSKSEEPCLRMEILSHLHNYIAPLSKIKGLAAMYTLCFDWDDPGSQSSGEVKGGDHPWKVALMVVPLGDFLAMENWLTSINLQHLAPLFHHNFIDDFLAVPFIRDEDLRTIGVIAQDRDVIMSSVSQLQRGESIELMKKWLAFMGFPDYAELFVSNFFDLTHLSRVTAEDVRNLGVENMDVGLAMEVFRQYAGFCAVKATHRWMGFSGFVEEAFQFVRFNIPFYALPLVNFFIINEMTAATTSQLHRLMTELRALKDAPVYHIKATSYWLRDLRLQRYSLTFARELDVTFLDVLSILNNHLISLLIPWEDDREVLKRGVQQMREFRTYFSTASIMEDLLMEKYRDIFVEQRISLDILLKLTDEKLRDMGVPLAVDRYQIMMCVEKLKKQMAPFNDRDDFYGDNAARFPSFSGVFQRPQSRGAYSNFQNSKEL